MTPTIRLCLVIHNHQPVGNFDGVFQQAYEDSYRPFLDVFQEYEDLKIALHTSGPLMEWLQLHHPDYIDRVAELVSAGRIEVIGGPFYEPILTMIPSRDRVGQITQYTRWLEDRLGGRVTGMWTPERVWEQSLVSDLASAGIQYTLLDDFHFKNAGLTDEALHGYYIGEDDGRLIALLPGSEPLRYAIPFRQPEQTIDLLRDIARRQPGAVVVFGDDGEKFGSWPHTKQHVYENGWLRQFFDALRDNRQWLQVTTPSEALASVPPLGTIYLPDCSYREMTEWALPVSQQLQFEDIIDQMKEDARWPQLEPFVRGGVWRNFKVKYPEAAEMYARMMMVSRRLDEARRQGLSDEALANAQRELYRGQCNCAYWHGAFGGIYLPHLRNAIYNHLIAADNLLDRATDRVEPWVEATADDLNFDSRQEVRLASEKLIALLSPAAGGQMYELDVRSICLNLLATMTRRPEAYHRKVLAGASPQDQEAASIHDRVVFKQKDLDQRLQYDDHPRKSLIDHFYGHDVTLQDVATCEVQERGDFVDGVYQSKLRRSSQRVQVLLSRSGHVGDWPLSITKGVTLQPGGATLEIAYLLEGLPTDQTLHFAVEMNFAGLPDGADDRYFYRGQHERLGQLGKWLDLTDTTELGLVDEWLGVDVHLEANRPTSFWAFPIQTVSQSEGGFELVHQSVAVLPHWIVQSDDEGRWSVALSLSVDTSMAEDRMENSAEAAAS